MNSYKGLDQSVLDKYLSLETHGKVQATYIWIDGSGVKMRGKTKTLAKEPSGIEDLPLWNFDGSSTEQAVGSNSDVYLRPVAMYRDPFRKGNHKLVLCETLTHTHTPTPSNKRHTCVDRMNEAKDSHPWFGIEQEYTLLDHDGHPLGWPKGGYPAPQGPYYCAVGNGCVVGREVMEAHYRACLHAGINIAGENAEVMLAQWEYQVGPCEGIEMGDQLWVSRYILERVAEDFGIRVSLDPKPMTGDWNGAGCHTNYSTEAMRKEGGMVHIDEAIKKLSLRHNTHMQGYDGNEGSDNQRRLTGAHETAPYHTFSHGVANRGCSVRIPRQCSDDGRGYFEDRRPSSNCDPYVVTRLIVETTVLNRTDE